MPHPHKSELLSRQSLILVAFQFRSHIIELHLRPKSSESPFEMPAERHKHQYSDIFRFTLFDEEERNENKEVRRFNRLEQLDNLPFSIFFPHKIIDSNSLNLFKGNSETQKPKEEGEN